MPSDRRAPAAGPSFTAAGGFNLAGSSPPQHHGALFHGAPFYFTN